MIALPEKAIEPAIASASPGQSTGSPRGRPSRCRRLPAAAASLRIGADAVSSRRPGRRAAVAGGDVALDRRIAEPPDELAGTEVLVAVAEHGRLVAALEQALDRRLRHRRLDVDLEPWLEAPARRVAGGLRLLPVRQHPHQRLQVALRLHVAAHDAEAHLRLAVLGEEGGNDGVERALSGRDDVRALRVEREAVAAVLHRDAPAGHDHARAEAHVVALDEAHHHAALVGVVR
jgi:hypothetical protein